MRTTALVLAALALALGSTGQPAGSTGSARGRPKATIVVQVHSDRGKAPTTLLGVNHHYRRNGYGLWDPDADQPQPAAVDGAVKAGIQSMRFPGGSVGNLYDWKRAIGPDRGCQVDGNAPHGPGLTKKLRFGPDEYMRFLDLVDAQPFIMMPFVTETPGDAADWVEYMNAQAGVPGNPGGGVDWADVRAGNGHPQPYGVHWWEIGNEQDHRASRYWLSSDGRIAVRQYAFGGSPVISGERLGKNCAHPPDGVRSDGSASQTFEMLYPPVRSGSAQVVVDGQEWTRVGDLAAASADDHVYTLEATSGRVTFGDGTHGAIPAEGSAVQASYRSVHQGFFAFARSMKAVDPSIKVCSSWGTAAFLDVVGKRAFDCLTTHPITSFGPAEGKAHWSSPLEGHDRFMLAAEARRAGVARLLGTRPAARPLLLTEFSAIRGDDETYPSWATSVSHAVYMSSQWAAWLNLRIRWGTGDDFLWGIDRAVLGPAPFYTFTADAVTRQALAPMFSAGGTLLATRTTGNPTRHPAGLSGSYSALTMAATRVQGALNLLVVNRLPLTAVRVRVELVGGRSGGSATITSVTGPSFTSWNHPGGPPDVTLHTRSWNIGATGFDYVFPAASTTVIRIPLG